MPFYCSGVRNVKKKSYDKKYFICKFASTCQFLFLVLPVHKSPFSCLFVFLCSFAVVWVEIEREIDNVLIW